MCAFRSANEDEEYTYERVDEIARYLKHKVSLKPRLGIVCGSGLGGINQIIRKPVSLEYGSIPDFPVSTVEGHAGQLVFGFISEVPIVCMLGRFHFYEGYALAKCTMPIRLMKLLGVEIVILSNAAGSINSAYRVGDIMFIKDHINFLGLGGYSPLRGRNDAQFGPRFVALNDAYNPQIIKDAKGVAKKIGLRGVHEGVYVCQAGPAYETVAEMRALKILGGDVAGMSTAHEVIAAVHCGMQCFAFSLITNEGVMDYETNKKPDHKDIVEAVKKREEDIKTFVVQLVAELGQKLKDKDFNNNGK